MTNNQNDLKSTSIKNYLVFICLFWTLGGVVLIALEVKQIKLRVETLDRKIKTAGISKKNEPQLQEIPPSSSGRSAYRVTEQDLSQVARAPLIQPKAEYPTPDSVSEIKSGESPPLGETSTPTPTVTVMPSSSQEVAQVPLAIDSDITIEDLELRRVPGGLETRFVMKNNHPGREIEGRIAGTLKSTLANRPSLIGSFPQVDHSPAIPAELHRLGAFYRFKYRLGKSLVFVTPETLDDSDFDLEFYVGAPGQTPTMIRIPKVRMPRVAQSQAPRRKWESATP